MPSGLLRQKRKGRVTWQSLTTRSFLGIATYTQSSFSSLEYMDNYRHIKRLPR